MARRKGGDKNRRGVPRDVPLMLACALVVCAVGVGMALRLGVLSMPHAPIVWTEPHAIEEPKQAIPTRDDSYTDWDAELYADYYRVVGRAVVDVEVPAGEIWYAPLDRLGRTVRAVGTIDAKMMEEGIARERQGLQGNDPSGWGHNAETDIPLPEGDVYHGHFWNRSHLVAKSLGGSDEVNNLVCATRMENVGPRNGNGGMSYAESRARRWLSEHPSGTLYYSAMPIYQGNELVCRSVIVDMRSSDGELDLQLEVFNAALGHTIDYATGEFE